MSLAHLSAQVRSGERKAVDIAAEAIERLQALDGLNLVSWMDAEMAYIQARAVDAAVDAGGEVGVLAGVPVALKDNLAFAGAPLECGSPALAGHHAVDNATVVDRLMAAGAVIVARTNMDEFAMGSSTETGTQGPARNPRNPAWSCGGSSGGSAGVVAAGAVPLALGSSTGGSVVQPAAHCGVIGLEPTYGRLSRKGLVAHASSLDRVGLFTNTVEDAALALSVLEGQDALDHTSLPLFDGAQQGLSIGLLTVDVPTQALRERLQRLPLHELTLPLLDDALACTTVISCVEAASNLARYDGIAYGAARRFGPEVTRRVLLGTHLARGDHHETWVQKAYAVRSQIQAQLDAALQEVDVLALPTTTGPFELGSLDPIQLRQQDRFACLAALCGNPAISIPCGETGLCLIGKRGQETGLLQAAALLGSQ